MPSFIYPVEKLQFHSFIWLGPNPGCHPQPASSLPANCISFLLTRWSLTTFSATTGQSAAFLRWLQEFPNLSPCFHLWLPLFSSQQAPRMILLECESDQVSSLLSTTCWLSSSPRVPADVLAGAYKTTDPPSGFPLILLLPSPFCGSAIQAHSCLRGFALQWKTLDKHIVSSSLLQASSQMSAYQWGFF